MIMINSEITQIIALAEKYPIISRVGVFGSYARGEQTPESDIDILFDYSSIDDDSVLEILDYGAELERGFKKLKLNVDYVSYKGVLSSKDKRTKNEILQDVVWVYRIDDGISLSSG
jgi:predicted nucleotidyltransferase